MPEATLDDLNQPFGTLENPEWHATHFPVNPRSTNIHEHHEHQNLRKTGFFSWEWSATTARMLLERAILKLDRSPGSFSSPGISTNPISAVHIFTAPITTVPIFTTAEPSPPRHLHRPPSRPQYRHHHHAELHLNTRHLQHSGAAGEQSL